MASYVYNIFGDVIDEAYDILSVDGDTNTYPGLARANFQKFANRFSKEFIDSVRLRTQEGTYTFTNVADTSLSADAASGATTLTITLSTGWPASGLCLVDRIPMTFTRSGSTLTVAATTRAFSSGDEVQLAYAVPSDYWRHQSMFLGEVPLGYQRRGDERGVTASSFVLYGDFVVLPLAAAGGQNVTWHYYKKGANTLSASDTMEIMEMWDSFVIFKLVAHGHGIMYDTENKQLYELEAEKIKRKARSHFARMDGGIGNVFIPGF